MQDWNKKIHVQSSLPPKPNQHAMFVGRWQPLHLGHQELFKRALDEGKNVLICIRDGEVNEKNPFTAQQVLENIGNEYKDLCGQGKIKIIIIPDICSIEFGRGVGYDIIEHVPPDTISEISATKVREQLRRSGKL
jgi:cytidyltransferase-like protein